MPILSRVLNSNSPRDKRALEKLARLYGPRQNAAPKLKHNVLSDKEVEGATNVFKHFDKNKDDSWSLKEFKEYVKWNTNYGVNHDRTEDVFKSMDKNKNGSLCVLEFLNYAALKRKPLPNEDILEDMFHKTDRNEDGLINLDELRQILLLLGEDVSQSEKLRRQFAERDKNKDGLINVFEFKRFIAENTARANFKKP